MMISRFTPMRKYIGQKVQRIIIKFKRYQKLNINMPHSIQKVFLTGANGFTASHILSDLVKV